MPSEPILDGSAVLLQRPRLLPRMLPHLLCLPAYLVCFGILIPFMTGVSNSLQHIASNYSDFLVNADFWNTFIMWQAGCIGVLGLELALAFAIAALLRRPTRLNDTLAVALLLPLTTAPSGPALLWSLITGPGFAAFGRTWLGHREWISGSGVATFAQVLVDVWINTPWMMILLLAGLRRLPRRRLEAARLAGARGSFVVFRIAVPALAPYFVAATALRLLIGLRLGDSVLAIVPDGQTHGPLVLRLPAYLNQVAAADIGRPVAVMVVLGTISWAMCAVLAAQWRRLRGRADANCA